MTIAIQICLLVFVHINIHFTNYITQLKNVAVCKMKGKGEPTILTDEWPHFSCTAIKISTPCFLNSNQVCIYSKVV